MLSRWFKKRAPAILALVAMASAGCDRFASEAGDGKILLSGTVEAHEIDLAFQVAGRIDALRVDEGDYVQAGDLVAVLEAQDYQLALERAQAESQAAAAALAVLRAGTREQEIRVAEQALVEAQARLRYAEAESHRTRRLVPNRLASEDQLEKAEMQEDIARATVARSRESLSLLQEGPRKEDIDQAAAELAARQASLAVAKRNLAYTRLQSPAPGIVTVRFAEPGEVVSAGQPVLRLAVLSRPWVRAYLAEADLARVTLGQRAEVRADGLPDRVFQGRLGFISPKAEFTPKTVETRELRVDLVYRIKVEVENPEGALKLGMPVDVTLDAGESS
jgi:HlyD family secretion protein